MSTPHIEAKQGQIAKTVLMPGDPLRAKFIAETFLEDVQQFNDVRNMFGYTGTYKGQRISVMGSGMGMPSIGIYCFELYTVYDVENIIRIGSAGAYTEKLDLYDVVLVDGSYSESSFAKVAYGYEEEIIKPSQKLNDRLEKIAQKLEIPVRKGIIHSSDVFYRANKDEYKDIYRNHGALCVEMESFALFATARYLNKNAACLLTISDNLVTQEETSADERQNSFTRMMEIALNIVVE